MTLSISSGSIVVLSFDVERRIAKN